MYPGEGGFPLVEILAALADDVTVGLEVPSLARLQRGVPAADRRVKPSVAACPLESSAGVGGQGSGSSSG